LFEPWPGHDSKRKDIIDILHSFSRKAATKPDTVKRQFNFSLVPSAGYTLSTGFAVDLSGNVVFYTDPANKEKLSTIYSNVTYDQHKQFLFRTSSSIWSKGQKYLFSGDWRLLKYPENTFGLGSLTTAATTTCSIILTSGFMKPYCEKSLPTFIRALAMI